MIIRGVEDRLVCQCQFKPLYDWEPFQFERHFKTQGHKKYEEKVEQEGCHQSQLRDGAHTKRAQEEARLNKEGTRATKSADHLKPFRKGQLKHF